MSIDRLEALRQEMKKCVRCSLCKIVPMPTIQQTRFTSACPPVDEYHFHAYSGGGIQIMALALLDQRIEADEEMARILSACTTCGMCDVACKFIMAAERQEVILALKEHLVEEGLSPAIPLAETPTHSYWAEGLALKHISESGSKVLLFVGAGANFDPKHAASARKLVHLLQHANVDFGVFEKNEPDSGIEAYWTGRRAVFAEKAGITTDRLNNTGAETIITLCGEDLGMLRAKYPLCGFSPKAKVVHASEFLLTLIQKGKLRLPHPIQQSVTYHDPCYLGRQSEPPQDWSGEERQTHGVMRYFVPPKPSNYGTNGVFDAPRQVLSAIPGLHFVEMHRIREYAYCCGSGGGVPDTHPNVARRAAAHRIDEALDTGAELLVTACQHCRSNLTCWQEENPLPVVDLVDLVYDAAGLE